MMDSSHHLFFDPYTATNRAMGNGGGGGGAGSNLLFGGVSGGGGGNINSSSFQGQGFRTMLSMEDVVVNGTETLTNKRKQPLPFFTSSEELLYDDEYYYDEQLPEKKRRLTPDQVNMLEKSFEAENKLEPERKTELAKKLGLQPRQVAVWFQNRRARWKTKQLERDFDLLKASYDSLLANYDSVIKENDHLKSQVLRLTDDHHKLLPDHEHPTPAEDDDQLIVLLYPTDTDAIASHQLPEEGLSSGTESTTGVLQDGINMQLVDSSGDDSYFPDSYYPHPPCIHHTDNALHSEEDDDNTTHNTHLLQWFHAQGEYY